MTEKQPEDYTGSINIELRGKIKDEPIQKVFYTGKYGSRPKQRPKERNCRCCNAPNWNPNHKCPPRDSICHNCKKKGHFKKVCRSYNWKQQEKKILGNQMIPKKAIPTNR